MGVSLCGLAIYIKKYFKAKKKWKLKYFTMQNYNRQKLFLKNQNPLRYYNYIISLKVQHKLKYQLSKILI
jgi:hypothetical protein